jgi:hypothetical protein
MPLGGQCPLIAMLIRKRSGSFRPTPVIVRTTSRTATIFENSVALRSGRRDSAWRSAGEAIDRSNFERVGSLVLLSVFFRCTRAQKLWPVFEVHCVKMRPAAAPDETVSLEDGDNVGRDVIHVC